MTQIKDPFSYSVGHGFAGISCQLCNHYAFVKKELYSKCTYNNFILNILRDKNGYARGEWFCKNFESNNTFTYAVEEFSTIKDELEDNVLYEACNKEYLRAIPFDELP